MILKRKQKPTEIITVLKSSNFTNKSVQFTENSVEFTEKVYNFTETRGQWATLLT